MSAFKSHEAVRTFVATVSKPNKGATTTLIPRRGLGTRHAQWMCQSCLQKTQQRKSFIADRALQRNNVFRQTITSSIQRRDEPRKPINPTPASRSSPTSTPDVEEPPSSQRLKFEPTTEPEPSSLPSQTAQQRWHSSQRLSHLMDTLLARASVASQQINTYTGTDYTGIEALRTRILDQESSVKERHSTVELARTSHREAHAKQSGAQKEIVSLLERKSSWSPGDLERYMGLVRSEHSLEADVSTAKDDLQAAERNLEDARSLLERLERKQYHEEQIWSDTIRRNSTWVTFGLMGVNIVLLLTQIAIFEPYRRRKIVREVKVALDEKAAVVGAAAPPTQTVQVEAADWKFDEGSGQPTVNINVHHQEAGAGATSGEESMPAAAPKEELSDTPLAAVGVLPEELVQVEQQQQNVLVQPAAAKHPETWTGSWEAALESLQDLFSERIVQVKKVDLTTMALQGAATGVAAMGLLFVMFRPR